MTRLYSWLDQATRRLSRDSAAQVRAEIQAHYESAREAAMSHGATADAADQQAIAALGDARAANCQYRKVLLTAAEARMLRQGNREARAICSRVWLKSTLVALSFAGLIAAEIFFLRGATEIARILLVSGLALGMLFTAPMFPVYTPSRSRIYRVAKWLAIVAMLTLVFGSDALKMSWLLISCLCPMIWIESTRAAIRRKLRVADWPKQLYL
jgi:Ca2+/Na+ antiporter